MNRMRGKTVIITGATSGMGKATAVMFAREGAEVLLVGRNEKRGAEVVREISEFGGKARLYVCDISFEENVLNLVHRISESYDKIDVLFNNAGIWDTSALEEIDEERIRKSFAINYDAIVLMSKYFMSMLVRAKGSIINNASMGGLDSFVNGTKQYVYASTKAAVIKFSKLLAKNYADSIRVNCICPGIIETEIFINRDFSRFDGTIPMGRIGQPDDVAKVVLFLASDDASYLTGVILPIDGGASLV
ncbi:SDR family NAD(P)-dependent oxidoreductase [Lachnospiraceae bacterium OM04-12BH]|nr:SDR family NAD(P)-dependent oxidoreductase [Lachnospiraceae bacterium OM04-12BH]